MKYSTKQIGDTQSNRAGVINAMKSMIPGRTTTYQAKPTQTASWEIKGIPGSGKRGAPSRFKPGPVSNGKGVGM